MSFGSDTTLVRFRHGQGMRSACGLRVGALFVRETFSDERPHREGFTGEWQPYAVTADHEIEGRTIAIVHAKTLASALLIADECSRFAACPIEQCGTLKELRAAIGEELLSWASKAAHEGVDFRTWRAQRRSAA